MDNQVKAATDFNVFVVQYDKWEVTFSANAFYFEMSNDQTAWMPWWAINKSGLILSVFQWRRGSAHLDLLSC